MSRFTVDGDDNNCNNSMNIKNLSGLSLDTSDIHVSPNIKWLKEAAIKKGLKLTENHTNIVIESSSLSHIKEPYSFKSNMFPINTDFEWPKISAIEKGLEILNRKSPELNSNEFEPIISPNSVILNSTSLTESQMNENNQQNDTYLINDLNSTKNKFSRNSIVFSTKKLLLENELLRQEDVKKEIERKKEDMENFSRNLIHQKAIMRTILAQKRQEEELEKIRVREAEEELMNEKIRQSEIRRKREQQLNKKRIQEQMEKLEHEQAEYAQMMKEKEELLEQFQPCPANFQAKCDTINTLATSCKDRNSAITALTPHYQKLKDLGQQMEIIKEKTQMGNITINDIHIAEDILRNVDEIVKQYASETEHIDNVLEAEIARREYEYKQAELQLHAASQSKNVELQSQLAPDKVDGTRQVIAQTTPLPVDHRSELEVTSQIPLKITSQADLQSYANSELWQIYTESKAYLMQYQITHKEFLQNDTLKKFRFEIRKIIGTAANAINMDNLVDKYNRVTNVLTGKSVPNIGMYPQTTTFCFDILAKKIVEQGESVAPHMAFGFASFAVAIWNDYPDFGDILMAHFRITCPYIIPIWLSPLEFDLKDYNDLKKHSGTFRLYACIIVSRQRQGVTKSHPHGLGNAWKWLAATLNIEPKVDTTEIIATLILDMLEVAGYFLYSAYPKQFSKLLNTLRCEYFLKLKNLANNTGGPITRLEEFLEKNAASGTIPPPKGLLPANYW